MDLPAVKRVGLRVGPIDVLLTMVVDIQVPMADTALMSLILTLLSLIPTRLSLILTHLNLIPTILSLIRTLLNPIPTPLSLIPTLLSLTILSLIPTEDIMEDIRTCLGQSVDMSDELTVAQPYGVVINAMVGPARYIK
jgi:hypothetical protein